MTEHSYSLVIGEKNYSSWSMRAWLMLRSLDLDFTLTEVPRYRPDSRENVRRVGGETGLVPVLHDEGLAIWDTVAILEYLHERHGGLWPEAPADRARARSYCGEVHSAFGAMRQAMPLNTRGRNRVVDRTPCVNADIARLSAIWEGASSSRGPWLFGEFGAVDIMFAPFATRIRTYDVGLSGRAEQYCDALLAHQLVAEWCDLGAVETSYIPSLEKPMRAGER